MTEQEVLRELYGLHDSVEESLRGLSRILEQSALGATDTGGRMLRSLWSAHDLIERAIIFLEATLPADIVAELHAE